MANGLRNITIVRGYSYGSRRQYPHKEHLAEFLQYLLDAGLIIDEDADYQTFNNQNFIPGDELGTSIILNDPIPFAAYLLVTDPDDSTSRILSRWWILSESRTTGMNAHQYRFTLRRDVIGDNFQSVENSPAYIEKGWINDTNTPYIWNKEGVRLDQVKKAEYPIEDETQMRWIVGYTTRGKYTLKNAAGEDTDTITQNFSQSSEDPDPAATRYASKSAFLRTLGLSSENNIYYFNSPEVVWGLNIPVWDMTASLIPGKSSRLDYSKNDAGSVSYLGNTSKQLFDNTGRYYINLVSPLQDIEGICLKYAKLVLKNLDLGSSNSYSNDLYNSLANANGIANPQIIYETQYNLLKGTTLVYFEDEKKNYNVSFTESDATLKANEVDLCSDNIFINYFDQNYKQDNYGITFTPSNKAYILGRLSGIKTMGITFTPKEYGLNRIVMPVDPANRTHLKDEPFDMFLIPFDDKNTVFYPGRSNYMNYFTASKDLAMTTANMLIQGMGVGSSSQIYDIQIVPYCPDSSLIVPAMYFGSNCSYNVGTYDEKRVSYLEQSTDGGANWSKIYPIYWCSMSKRGLTTSGTGRDRGLVHFFYTGYELPLDELSLKPTALDAKVANESQLWRLNSPNFQGAFDFSPQMNLGVDAFRIDVDYKPFNPYIHVAPVFKGMYGKDFGDARGLICGGDFSFPVVNDQWTNYQLQNKNYESIFNRQIQNLETTQDVQRQEQKFAIASNIVQAGFGGFSKGMTGGLISGPLGVGLGVGMGVVNAGASAIGGAMDWQNSERLRAEQIDYSKDLHRMSLQNIQALPYSLTKTGAQYITNREFPFLELYEAPSAEIDALRDKIRFDGMTIAADGKISDYLNSNAEYTFIKGLLERIPSIESPGLSNLYDAIQQELQFGVYFYSKEA